ncbi:MAG: serine acetyltransferase [Lentisphaeraceae bacterium]|nr:serine acetyltransferase [Lentisphaeraceae bacterium]
MTLSLKDYWHAEILGGRHKKFSWFKVFKRARRSKRCNFMFWYRMAYVLYRKNNKTCKSLSNTIALKLMKRYSVEIMLGAEIGEGLMMGHNVGIVITKSAKIGKNFRILQNTTIGADGKLDEPILIGDNVSIGANTCIIGSGLKIGSNVTIGAMSFVNKDIPDNVTYITRKESRIIVKEKVSS